MRPSDIFGRYGGEEFVLGLMDCDAENARRCAERIRTTMESSSIATGSGGAEDPSDHKRRRRHPGR
jgi:PleD family two-component response regulator